MTTDKQLLLSAILSNIKVTGELFDKTRIRSFYWFKIYVDNCKVFKSNKRKPISQMLSWEYGSETKINFSASSVIRVKLHRGFGWRIDKVPLTKIQVTHFEGRIEQLLDNDSQSIALKNKKGGTIAQMNITLSLLPAGDEFISDFMKKVECDVANLKGTEGFSTRVMSVLGPILQNTRTLMDIVADANPILKISWTVISRVYDATQDTEIKDQSIRELAETLREMLATANEKLDLPRIPDAVDIIKEIGLQSIQVASLVHEYTRSSFAVRTLKLGAGSMSERIEACQSRCLALKDRFYERVQLETNKTVKESQDAIKNIKTEVRKLKDDAIAEKFFKWLWPSDRPIDISKNYNEAHGKRHQQTCSWFLEDERFGRWLHKPGFIWVHGKAGSGKTILMSSIIDKLPKPNSSTGVAHFFFDARDGQTDSQLHMKFIRSLAYQLCDSRHGGIPQQMVDLYTDCGSLQPLDDQLEDALQQILVGFERVFIVLDALDECSDRERTLDWVRKLLAHAQTQTNIHLLITSRREVDITDVFHNLAGDHVDVVNPANKDIEGYISERIKSSKLQRFNETIRGDVERRLRDRADGSFRYTALMVAELEQCSSLAKLEKALTELPDGLNEIYARILFKCKSEDALDLRKFLQFLAFSMEAIRLDELAEIITIEFSSDDQTVFNPNKRYADLSDILVLCGGLVVVAKDSWYSLKEYLISCRVQDTFRLVETAAHIDISKTLLSYLLEMYSISNDPFSPAFPLRNYAALTWVRHVQYDSEGVERDAVICKLVARLLSIGIPGLVSETILELTSEESPRWNPNTVVARALHWASILGIPAVIENLLGEVGNKNTGIYPDGERQQAASATKHHVAKDHSIKGSTGWDVNAVGGMYGTALQAASVSGNKSVVAALLKHGADINAVGGKFGTALQAASYAGHQSVVRELLEYGADVNVVGGEYGSALHAASSAGHNSVVKALLQSGADVHAIDGKLGIVPEAAATGGLISSVEALLTYGAHFNGVCGGFGTALQVASSAGKELVVETLLLHGADVNAVGGKFGTALQAAAYGGHQSLVEALVKHGADVNVVSGYYGTALQAASFRGYNSMIETLLKHGAYVNAAIGGVYGTALQAAACTGHGSVIEALLKHGADVNAVGGKYGTALQAASYIPTYIGSGSLHTMGDLYGANQSLVKKLLKYGADNNAVGENYVSARQAFLQSLDEARTQRSTEIWGVGGNSGTSIQIASSVGKDTVVELLLQHGADVNTMGGKFATALQAASVSGCTSVIKTLLQHGADVNAVGGMYGTALQAASYRPKYHNMRSSDLMEDPCRDNQSSSKTLLQHGTDVNLVHGDFGKAALQAMSIGGSYPVVEALLKHGSDVNIVGGAFNTALQAAAYGGHQSLVGALLKLGADINAVGGLFNTALHAASSEGHNSVVEALLQHGADVNIVCDKFGTALHAASSEGHNLVVEVLLQYGADVNVVCGKLGTPLQVASRWGRHSVVEALLQHGAEVNVVCGEFGTALHAASSKGHNSVVEALLQHGANVNAIYGELGTALHVASFVGHNSVVEVLLQYGADFNVIGKYGTALQMASVGNFRTAF
ncbi:Vegetative incompatibility protein HET-E-1 [Psilocybe cubensis]|nr:Vegetative incompatibility protein HET-E-1 [Psilocybe cubensis]KAH9477165.1 Vegetative incompatibility protein HET-E-1 [Psilocybe cubensis]